MEWLNVFGLAVIAVIMIPNIIFALRHKAAFENRYRNRAVEIIEHIGRFGCIGFMIFNIPCTRSGWWFDGASAVCFTADVLLVALYLAVWIICRRKNDMFKALALSVIPSAVFLLSGIMMGSVLLIISSMLFAPAHIFISCKNTDKPVKVR